MTDSVFTRSVVVGGEVAAGRVDLAGLPEQPVVPDAGGEGEHALADARPDPFGDVAAVILERELALGGVDDRLDPLADAAERAEALGLALAIGADELRVERGDDLLKLLSGEPLSPMTISSPLSSPSRRARSSIAAATSRSGSLAGARQK
jgi:hypothetical protein